MHRSVSRVTRPKLRPNQPHAEKEIYPANGPEIDAAFPGQYIAFVEGLQDSKPIWKVLAHHETLSGIHQALTNLPKTTQAKSLVWYVYSPAELADLNPLRP